MFLHFLLSLLLLLLHQVPTFAVPKHYIVYLGSHHAEPRLLDSLETITNSHHELISSVLPSDSDPSERIIHSYNKIFNAFAATLFEEEANELARHPSVVSIFKSRQIKLHTTRSAEFLGLPMKHKEGSKLDKSVWEKASYGEDIIIGVLDSGVVPESKSFSDEGYGPIPKRFKGVCANENDPTFKCNRKLIGARYFHIGMAELAKSQNIAFDPQLTPRDNVSGHGSHTLSIAGGNFVPNTSWAGFANGTAKGMAPRARLASYRVLWKQLSPQIPIQADDIDILAGFEAAINDGVDIINLSMGQDTNDDYLVNSIYIGTFYAMMNGILTIAAAGNEGPEPKSVGNIAPWMLTVAASTIDREFSSYVVLGNKQKIKGKRFFDVQFKHPIGKVLPLITGEEARIAGANITEASWCYNGTLDATKVAGKIVVCLHSLDNIKLEAMETIVVRKAGAVGLILANTKTLGCGITIGQPHFVTTVAICYKDAQTLLAYIHSTRNPTASITDYTTSYGIKPTPVMAHFSSRGPNSITPDILKPDVTAPGVDILGATLSELLESPYVMKSGTSQAAPHVAGIAALIKKLHPDWHTAAIKSAIMTTASPLDNNGLPILDHDKVKLATPLAFGSGHVRPDLAIDPGLVYDMNHYDYLNFLCSHEHNNTNVETFSDQHSYKCPPSFNILDFNLPSVTITEFTGNAIATRKVKNVGQPGTYTPRIEAPQGVTIVVEPNTLVFTKKDQVINFKLMLKANVNLLPNDYIFGSLTWSDGKHVVRSPIVIKAKKI